MSGTFRRLRREFPPIADTEREDASSQFRSFYRRSLQEGPSRLTRSAYGKAEMRESKWTPSRCAANAKELGIPEYARTPFKSREEYVSMIMAFLHLPEYEGQMRRRHKNVSVETMLRRAIRPETIEYPLNGSWFLDRKGKSDRSKYPIGATTNEALAREIKGWGGKHNMSG